MPITPRAADLEWWNEMRGKEDRLEETSHRPRPQRFRWTSAAVAELRARELRECFRRANIHHAAPYDGPDD